MILCNFRVTCDDYGYAPALNQTMRFGISIKIPYVYTHIMYVCVSSKQANICIMSWVVWVSPTLVLCVLML